MSKIVKETESLLKSKITQAITSAIEAGELPEAEIPDFIIEVPSNKANGDYSSNAAMAGARVFKKAPKMIAEIILKHISLENTLFDRAEIAGPGFLNFFLSQKFYGEILKDVFDCGDDYGKSDYGDGKKVLVEFVSANPIL